MDSRRNTVDITEAETAMVDSLIDYYLQGDKCVPTDCILVEEYQGEPWVRVQWYEC